MRIDSNLEKLLKNYQEKLSEYKKIYGEYTFAKEHPEILMSEEDKTRYPDEKSQKDYLELQLWYLETRRKAAFDAVEDAKADYLDNYGNPEELNRVYKEVMNEEPKTKPLTKREQFKNSLRIVRNAHDKLLVTTDPTERKKLNKLIQENSPILQKLRPVLGFSVVNEVVNELEKEEKGKDKPKTKTGSEEVIPLTSGTGKTEDDSDMKIYTPSSGTRSTKPEETTKAPETTPETTTTTETEPETKKKPLAKSKVSTITPKAKTGAKVTKKGIKGVWKKVLKTGAAVVLLIAGIAGCVWLVSKLTSCSKNNDEDKNKAFDDDNKEQIVMVAPSETPTPTPTTDPNYTFQDVPTSTATYTFADTNLSDATYDLSSYGDSNLSDATYSFEDTDLSSATYQEETPEATPTPTPSPEPTEEVQTFEWTSADEATRKGINNYIGTYSLTEEDKMEASRGGYRSIISDQLDLANQGIDQYQNYNSAVTLGEKFMDGQMVNGITIDQLNANQKAAFASDLRNSLGYATTDGDDINRIDGKLRELEDSVANELANQKVKTLY